MAASIASHKNALITRVRTRDGVVGEAVNGEGQADLLSAARKLLVEVLAPQMIGRDAGNIEACWEAMFATTHRIGLDRRALIRAIACIDSALWDALGKRTGQSLHRLWGGYADELADHRHRRTIYRRRIAGTLRRGDGRAARTRHRRVQVQGRRIVAAGGRGADPRGAKGGRRRFILCVDANRGWPRETAIAFAKLVPDLNLRWFEEPCHWQNDRRDMAAVRMLTGLPVVAGQSEVTAQACRDLITDGAIDICNIDASWGGGATPWLKIAHLADCFGVQMAHHGEPVIGAQLLAAVPNGTYVETHHPDRDPIFHKMIQGRGEISNGKYRIPSAPGWGISSIPTSLRVIVWIEPAAVARAFVHIVSRTRDVRETPRIPAHDTSARGRNPYNVPRRNRAP